VRPYLDSKFCLQGVSSNRKGVVFGSSAKLSFANWLFMWLKQLISSTTGDEHCSGALVVCLMCTLLHRRGEHGTH
jgi:hypothetical protein